MILHFHPVGYSQFSNYVSLPWVTKLSFHTDHLQSKQPCGGSCHSGHTLWNMPSLEWCAETSLLDLWKTRKAWFSSFFGVTITPQINFSSLNRIPKPGLGKILSTPGNLLPTSTSVMPTLLSITKRRLSQDMSDCVTWAPHSCLGYPVVPSPFF